MQVIASIAVALVALVHAGISVVEMFLWKRPQVHGRLGFQQDVAAKVAPIVANAGLYNAFLMSGLVWSLLATNHAQSLQVFFLSCVAIAGIYGAATLKRTTLVLQTLPAVLAGILVWIANRPAP